jgi:leader peptidase (prepilin peptidase) / N-methyltransferase
MPERSRGSSSAMKWTAQRTLNRLLGPLGALTRLSLGETALLGAAAAASVAASLLYAPGLVGLTGAAMALVMLAIALTDWRYFIIPNWLNGLGLALALLHACARDPSLMIAAVIDAAIRAIALALLFLAVRYLYARFRGRQGLGLGDVKLAAVAGAWLDVDMIAIAVQLAVLSALLGYAARQWVLRRPVSATTRLPFGVFLAPSIWICWFLQTAWLTPL